MTDKKTPPADKMPTEEELDALQKQIDEALGGRMGKNPEGEAADAAPAPAAAAAADGMAEALADMDKPEVTPLSIAGERIAELEAEVATLKDQALRSAAEAQNIAKRAEREVAAARSYGIERFAVDMLSVSDNLGRALLGLEGINRDDLGDNAKSLVEGIELTEKELIAVFARHGIKPVPGEGSKFDPNLHQAVAQVPSEHDKGDVANVMQTGFTLGERTLRAAMVAVSNGPAKS